MGFDPCVKNSSVFSIIVVLFVQKRNIFKTGYEICWNSFFAFSGSSAIDLLTIIGLPQPVTSRLFCNNRYLEAECGSWKATLLTGSIALNFTGFSGWLLLFPRWRKKAIVSKMIKSCPLQKIKKAKISLTAVSYYWSSLAFLSILMIFHVMSEYSSDRIHRSWTSSADHTIWFHHAILNVESKSSV